MTLIEFENWPYDSINKSQQYGRGAMLERERLLLLKTEYYGRGKTFEQKARDIGMSASQYYHLREKHGLLEDENGYLKNPREDELD